MLSFPFENRVTYLDDGLLISQPAHIASTSMLRLHQTCCSRQDIKPASTCPSLNLKISQTGNCSHMCSLKTHKATFFKIKKKCKNQEFNFSFIRIKISINWRSWFASIYAQLSLQKYQGFFVQNKNHF